MEGTDLERVLDEWVASSAGAATQAVTAHLRTRARVFAIAAVPAFLIAWPVARSLLDWLVNGSGLLPSDIEPITTSPLDVVLIQLRTTVALVSIVLGGLVLLDLTRFAAQSDAVRTRMDELDLRRIRPTRLALGITSASVLLLATGAAYSLGFLTPFLLEYFSSDASDLGVDVAWTIPAFVGFVVDLTLASSIGFLTPVLTWTVLRLGILERSDLTRQRRAIWFAAVVAGAVMSPPDPLSLVMVTGPILLLFEVALVLNRWTSS